MGIDIDIGFGVLVPHMDLVIAHRAAIAEDLEGIILGIGRPAIGRLITWTSLDMEFRTFKIRHDRNCPVCGDHPTIKAPIDYEQFCGVPILDPKSLAETAAEVKAAKQPASAGAKKSDPTLDDRGLPPGYAFDPNWEVTPRDVKSMLDKGDKFLFIDCRLPNEYQITHIDGTKLIPLQQIGQHISSLRQNANDKIIVHCRSGGRSMQFAQLLRQNGFADVKSMAGGILLWNKDINPGGPQY